MTFVSKVIYFGAVLTTAIGVALTAPWVFMSIVTSPVFLYAFS